MEDAIRNRLQIMQKPVVTAEERGSTQLDISKITELILDGYTFPFIQPMEKSILQGFTSLTKLTCNQTGLASLENFPSCNTLKVLELTDNHIRNNLQVLCEVCPNVRRLELGGNHIDKFEDLQPLEKLPFLEQLGLDMNPLSTNNSYKQKVWEILPNLKVLDGCDREGNEIDINTDDDEGVESEDEEEDSGIDDNEDGDIIDDDEEDNEDDDEMMETDSPNKDK